MSFLKLMDGNVRVFNSREEFIVFLQNSEFRATGDRNTDYYIGPNKEEMRRFEVLRTAKDLGMTNQEIMEVISTR